MSSPYGGANGAGGAGGSGGSGGYSGGGAGGAGGSGGGGNGSGNGSGRAGGSGGAEGAGSGGSGGAGGSEGGGGGAEGASGGAGEAPAPVAESRAKPAAQNPPLEPLLHVDGSPHINVVLDVVNDAIAPFRQGPEAPKGQDSPGVALWVSHVIKAGTGILGVAANAIDYGIASVGDMVGDFLGISYPAFPAITITGAMIGPPHSHTHPPSFGAPLLSAGMVIGPGAVTVLVGGLPPARLGDFGLAPTCGGFFPPFDIVTGSSSVFIGGARAARLGDLIKHCNTIDPPDPGTKTFGKSGKALDKFGAVMAGAGLVAAVAGGKSGEIAQAAADAAAFVVKSLIGKDPGVPPLYGMLVGPPVMNVVIGGFPCPGIGSHIGGLINKGLGKLISKIASKAASALGSIAKRLQCIVGSSGHPIYLVTGENYDSFVDYSPGTLFSWRRHYTSARRRHDSPLGFGWRHYYQRNLRRRLHRATFQDWDGVSIEFGRFELGSSRTSAAGYVLTRLGKGHFKVSQRGQPDLEFRGDEFDSELPLTRVSSASAALDLEYDALGRLAALVETARASSSTTGDKLRRYELVYDARGHITQLVEVELNVRNRQGTRPIAVRSAYSYSDSGTLLRSEDCFGQRWQAEYDGLRRLSAQTDARGYRYEYTYDASDRCVASSGQDGLWWCRMQYFPEQGMTRVTEGDNATSEYYYDDAGIIIKIVNPVGGVLQRQLDERGRIVLEVDPGGRERRWLYDADDFHYGRVDRFGNLFPPEYVQPREPNPFARRLPDRLLGFLFSGRVTPRTEAMLGIDPALLAPLPPAVQRRALLFLRTRPAGGDAIARPDIPLNAPEVTRDGLGRKLRETDALGRSRAWEYDQTGNLIASTDGDGSRTTQQIVSWNLVGSRASSLGYAIRYEYSKLEQITAIIDPLGNQSGFDYDARARLVGVHRQGTLRERYVYDEGDHFIAKHAGDGRLLFQNTIHDNHFVAVRQLASGGFHRFDYDAHGRLTEASTEAHRIQLAYNFAGQRKWDLRDGRGVEHDHRGDRGSSTTVLGRYQQRTAPRTAALSLSGPSGNVTTVEHGEIGLVQRRCSNGSVELLQFDERGRLEASLRFRRDLMGDYNVSVVRYSYSVEGDLLKVNDNKRGTTEYRVDRAHRLAAELTPRGTEYEYRLDAAGNLCTHPVTGPLDVAPGNQLRATRAETFSYDSRNHLSQRQSRRDGCRIEYHYDSFDMLVRIERCEPELPFLARQFAPSLLEDATPPHPDDTPHCNAWRAAYDALGRRLWTSWTTPDGKALRREFFWDGDRLGAEILPNGQLRIYQYASADALSPLQFTDYLSLDADPSSGKSYHVFCNATGMPLCIENELGHIVWWVERADPYGLLYLEPKQDLDYGRPGSAIDYNLRWPGHYYDPETGLHYNRYRYYDPHLGRYLQSDPVGHAGSPINLYAYCSNPVVQVDVLGLEHEGKGNAAPGASDEPSSVSGKEANESKAASDEDASPEASSPRPPLAIDRKSAPAHPIPEGGSPIPEGMPLPNGGKKPQNYYLDEDGQPQRRPVRQKSNADKPATEWEPPPKDHPNAEAIQKSREQQAAAAEANKGKEGCAASADDTSTHSGYDTPEGFEPNRRGEVHDRGDEIGHDFGNGGARDQGEPGQFNSSHAEKQASLAKPGEPTGVDKPMCRDCRSYFRQEANASNQDQVVTDPQMTRVFHPDGSVTEMYPDGSTGSIAPTDPY